MAALAGGWPYTARLRNAIVAAAVGELGINRIRMDITGALEGNGEPSLRTGVAVNDNRDPRVADLTKFNWTRFDAAVTDWVLPIRQRVEARGEPFVLQVTYNGHVATSAFQKNPAEYAELVSVVLNRLRDHWGLEPDLWDVANEPDNPVTKTGLELGRMVRAAGDRARSEGFHKLMFVGPSVTDARNAASRLRGMLSVPGVRHYLAEASYHRYRRGATARSLSALRDLAQANGLRVGQSEFIGADYKMLYTDLTQADVSVWSQYTLACCGQTSRSEWNPGGAYYPVFNDGTFELSSRGGYLRQYMKYIRPGAVRVDATSVDGAIQPVAFRSPDGLMVVVANTSRKATLTVAGLPGGTYGVTYTTIRARGARGAPVTITAGETLVATIPAAGVITLAASGGARGDARARPRTAVAPGEP